MVALVLWDGFSCFGSCSIMEGLYGVCCEEGRGCAVVGVGVCVCWGFFLCVGEGGGGLVCVCSFGVWVLELYMCVSFCGEILYAFGHLGRV